MAHAPEGSTATSKESASGERETESREAGEERVVESYVEDVRVVEVPAEDGESSYRFEAPRHCGKEFEDREQAELYADVYFDAGGFREESTGEVGVPAGLFQAGNDTLAAYLLALPSTDREWVRSFYGVDDDELDQFVEWVRARAEESRERAREAQS